MRYPSRLYGSIFVILLLGLPVLAAESEEASEKETQHLDWNRPVLCVMGPQGKLIRIQCSGDSPAGRSCLVAPNERAGGGELRRVAGCNGERRQYYMMLQSMGYKMIPAIAEAPPGWYRDEKGRVFQVTFDLFKRYYLGIQWSPAFDLSPRAAKLDRVRFDMGFVASWLAPEHRNRHSLRALEGFVVVDDLEIKGRLFAYDLSHASTTPLLRITTFFGKPMRHDLFMDIGCGLELADLHVHPHRSRDLIELEFAEFHVAWDVWQSADLYNHIRLKTGVGIGGMWELGDNSKETYILTPNVAIESKFGLDRDGFHYLLGDLYWVMPVLLNQQAGVTKSRAGLTAAYEMVFLAISFHSGLRPVCMKICLKCFYADKSLFFHEWGSKWPGRRQSDACWLSCYRSAGRQQSGPMISSQTNGAAPFGFASIRPAS
ncbi:MAG: hypothetical protein JRJ19_14515 [Deltaproteobacteria bacterium]|nr:hypothetical protein [Deltaproteobacteria bacterium]